MNTQEFDLNKLRIASPCSVGWDSMAGDERMRFCGSCELNVYNVAGMTRDEVGHLISNSNGRLCMRLHRRWDGTVITNDCPVGLRAYRRRVGRFAGATLAAIFGLFSISYGQKQNKAPTTPEIKISETFDELKVGQIFGTVTDPHGAVVPGVEIVVLRGKELRARVVSDSEGSFVIKGLARGEYELRFARENFEALTIQPFVFRSDRGLMLTVILAPELTKLTGVVAVPDMPVELESPLNTPPTIEITSRKKQ